MHRLGDVGLSGSDTVYYTHLAQQWSEGNRALRVAGQISVPRPLLHYLNSRAVSLLGPTDSSIKRLNAGADCLNIVLIFLVTTLVWPRSRGGPLAPAALWAFLPAAIHFSRIELPHTLSTTCVLLSAIAFSLSLRASPRLRRLALLTAGAIVGLAAMVHEDLVLLSVGYVGFLWLRLLTKGNRVRSAEQSLLDTLFFALGLILTTGDLRDAHLVSTAAHGVSLASHGSWNPILEALVRTPRYLWNGIIGLGSSALLLLFAGTTVAWLCRWLFHRPSSAAVLGWNDTDPRLFPIVAVLGYSVSYGLFLDFFILRVFLPLMPLVLIATTVAAGELLKIPGQPAPRATLWLAVVLIVAANLLQFPALATYTKSDTELWFPLGLAPSGPADGLDAMKDLYEKSWERTVVDLVRSEIGPESRLLVAPSLFYSYPGRRVFQSIVYLGDDAVYLVDHPEALGETLRDMRIGFVLISHRWLNERLLDRPHHSRYMYDGRWARGSPLCLGAACAIDREQYTVEAEIACLLRELDRRGARLVAGVGDLEQRTPRSGAWALYRLPEKTRPDLLTAARDRRGPTRGCDSRRWPGTMKTPKGPS